MRIAEIALLLVPVALLLAWLCGLRGLSVRGLAAALLLLAGLALLLMRFGQDRGFTGAYAPAALHDGQVVPGHPG